MSAAATTADPKALTIKGRLSFPRFTMPEAIAGNATSKFPKKDDKIAPEYNLLLEQDQLDKIFDHLENVFLPYVEEQAKKGEKRDAIEPKFHKKLVDWVKARDLEEQPPMVFIKPMSEKNQEAAPECVASVKLLGSAGVDIVLKASVYSEDQLAVPDPDILSYPVLKPIGETVFGMYAGAYVATTINLFAFFSSASVYGVSAGATVAVYMGNLEGERLGGGAVLDESAIFMD